MTDSEHDVGDKNLSSRFDGVDLVGTVGTMYKDPNDVRFEVTLDTAERYQQAGLPLIVIDSSMNETSWVADALKKRNAIVLEAGIGGVATQRQQGVSFAVQNGARKIVGHEPEKNLMVDFAAEIAESLNTTDVLVIGRTLKAQNSLPPVQQRTERLAGWTLEKTLDLPHDSLSGGRGFTVVGAEALAAYPAIVDGMNNWNYLYETVLNARSRGYAVGGLVVDLTHPAAMVAQETGDPAFDSKRYMQFNLQLSYLLRKPEVGKASPEARGLAKLIVSGLELLPIQPTPADNPAYEAYLDGLERQAQQHGYVAAER